MKADIIHPQTHTTKKAAPDGSMGIQKVVMTRVTSKVRHTVQIIIAMAKVTTSKGGHRLPPDFLWVPMRRTRAARPTMLSSPPATPMVTRIILFLEDST